MVRGDCDVNEEKVKRHLTCRNLSLAPPHVIRELTDAEVEKFTFAPLCGSAA
jgi:prolyl-tRNA editing enzyme YbaK/EbsC (Cys-tRNA(Pro) deacylase)